MLFPLCHPGDKYSLQENVIQPDILLKESLVSNLSGYVSEQCSRQLFYPKLYNFRNSKTHIILMFERKNTNEYNSLR